MRSTSKVVLFIALFVIAFAGLAIAQEVPPVTGAVGIEEKIIAVINGLLPLVSALMSLGLITKYVPLKILGYVNNHLIPVMQAVLAFLFAFGGGAAVAHAGLFGDIASYLSVAGKATASLAVTYFCRQTFETFARPLFEKVLKLQNNEALVGKA